MMIRPALLTPAPNVFGAAIGTLAVAGVSCFSTSACPAVFLLFKSDVDEAGMIAVVDAVTHVNLLFLSTALSNFCMA
jgi:hypothetical protein